MIPENILFPSASSGMKQTGKATTWSVFGKKICRKNGSTWNLIQKNEFTEKLNY